ncbi:hypothetical protein [Sphingobacterium sp. 1.A.5]|uniref:hypothetical protein n=1 Tax=Sphingobacterium sp. 1.A.5 TaxID=2044604 RepID=UPI000C0BFCFF|nr:hypothetical protein [Sphingobacterium sp. 1.A.5]
MSTHPLEQQLENLNSEVTEIYNLLEELVQLSRKQLKILEDINNNSGNIEYNTSRIADNT